MWLAGAARHRAFWLGLPLLLYAWTITGPFVFDDLHLVLKGERYLRGESAEPALFRFARTPEEWTALRDGGTVPWWAPAGQRIDLFRPLSEWSFCLDLYLFGRNPLGHRLVSLAWFAVALLCVRRLFLIAGGDPARAGLSAFFLGISQTWTQPITFICNRSDLLVIVGTTLAAGAYWSATDRRWRYVLLAAAAYAFALLSKEAAVGLAAVVLLHELLVRRRVFRTGENRSPDRTLPGTIAVLLVLMAVAYVAYYAVTRPWHLGLDYSGSLSNVSILSNAPRALPLYLAVWTTGFPISALLQAGWRPVLTVSVAGLVGAGVTLYHLRRHLRADPAAAFFLLWSSAFLGVALLTIPETRVLSVATIGWAYLLSGLLVPSKSTPTPTPRWLRHWLLAANGAVSIGCAIATVLLQTTLENQCRQSLAAYVAAAQRPLRDGDTLIVYQPRSEMELLFAGDRLEFLTQRRRCGIAFLALPSAGAEFRRMDDRTLSVTTAEADLLGSPAQRFLLGRGWRPSPGQRFHHRDFTAEITGMADDDRVLGLLFHFPQPITSPRIHLIPPTPVTTSPTPDS